MPLNKNNFEKKKNQNNLCIHETEILILNFLVLQDHD